ncbi:MAG: lipoprotein [Zoogloeaceae bacterium]|jgi:predicted small lipoprotein YifL|nr:lipoprotein [Zoogloeaceae bacterium]
MNSRLFLLLPLLSLLAACGMKGALERPSGPVPPSLYKRVFGAKAAPEQKTDAPVPEIPTDASAQDNPTDIPIENISEGNEP